MLRLSTLPVFAAALVLAFVTGPSQAAAARGPGSARAHGRRNNYGQFSVINPVALVEVRGLRLCLFALRLLRVDLEVTVADESDASSLGSRPSPSPLLYPHFSTSYPHTLISCSTMIRTHTHTQTVRNRDAELVNDRWEKDRSPLLKAVSR